MDKKILRIMHEAPEGTGSGGTVETSAINTPATTIPEETVETTEVPEGNEPVVDDGQNNAPVTEEPNNEEGETEEGDNGAFNPEEVEFEGVEEEGEEGTSSFDVTQIEFLESEGIDIKTPQVSSLVNNISSLGVTDPEVIANFVRKYNDEITPPTPQEVKQVLAAKLTPEEKRNYSTINNTLKKAWGEDKELQPLINQFMSSPTAVKAVNALIKKLRNGTDPNPKSGNVPKTSQGLSFDKAIVQFEEMAAQSIQKNGRLSMGEKTRIVSEISSKLSPVDVKKFKERYF